MFRMRKILRKFMADARGAAVVETAVIVPMIWVIIMGSILLLFFFFDMGVLKSETMRTANEVAVEWREEDHGNLAMEKKLFEKRLREKLLITRLESDAVKSSLGTVTVNASIGFSLSGKSLTFGNTSRSSIDNREDWMRLLSK